MLRFSGVGLAAMLLSGTALAQTPANSIQGDVFTYGGFELQNDSYNPDFYHWYAAGTGSRVNVPFGGMLNFELETRADTIIYPGGGSYTRSLIISHLYARDPGRFAAGLFGGYATPRGYAMVVGGGEAQASVGNAIVRGQGLFAYGGIGCDNCEASAMQGRVGFDLFVTPTTSFAVDGLLTRYAQYSDSFLVLGAIATVSHQIGESPFVVFAQAEYDRVAYSWDDTYWTNTLAFRGGIRILFGPPGTTLQASATTGPAMDTLFPTSRLSCFVGDTSILMADGSTRRIDEVRVGDWVVGAEGEYNRVVEIETPLLGDRRLHAFGAGRAFVTAEHPFMTREGWKSIDPEATREETRAVEAGVLTAADEIVTLASVVAEARPMRVAGGAGALAPIIDVTIETAYAAVGAITAHKAPATTRVFNLRLDGNHTYFADGYLVHNK